MIKAPISVLIPTMNRPESLQKTIESYLHGDVLPSQIVIVDQSNDEDLKIKVQNIATSYNTTTTITYIWLNEPALTKARNMAIKVASEEILIVSDDDVLVNKDTLSNVVNTMRDEKISLIAGLSHKHDKKTKKSSLVSYLVGAKSFCKRKKGHVTLSLLGRYPQIIKGHVETEYAMGYFFVIRKSLLDKWGINWDEKLTGYAYPEDLDFSYAYYKKSKIEGLKCILSEDIVVEHCVSTEYRTPSRKSAFMMVVNRLYLSYKHNMGLKSRLAMRWYNFWLYIKWKMNKQDAKDLKDAIIFARKYRKDIKNGILFYD